MIDNKQINEVDMTKQTIDFVGVSNSNNSFGFYFTTEENKDIVEFLGKNNKYRPRLVVGFSAETENLNKNSISKMKRKNCDLIIANNVSKKDIGFNSDYNKVSIIDNNGEISLIKKNRKSYIADKIVKIVLDKLLFNDRNFN